MALQADRVLLEQVGRQAGGAEQPQLQRQASGRPGAKRNQTDSDRQTAPLPSPP